MQAGKTTIAKHLIKHHGYEHLSFAGPLKQDILDMGFPEWAIELKPDWMRRLMQVYGRAWRSVDPDHWVDTLAADLWNVATMTVNANIVIDDLRFENEAHYLRRLDPKTFDVELVRVVRVGSQDAAQAIRSDQSETDLDHWHDWDLIVQAGSGDITGLLQSVERGLGLPLRS